MKLIILHSVFVWSMLLKIIVLKTNIASTEDFIVNFNENFKNKFDSEEKLEKFKNHLVRKMKYRIKERFLRNSMLMELLQVKEKFAIGNKNNKERIKKNKILKKIKSLRHTKINQNNEHAKNKTFDGMNPSINVDEVNFMSKKNETENKNEIIKNRKKPSFRIDFKLQNSSIAMHKKNFIASSASKSFDKNNQNLFYRKESDSYSIDKERYLNNSNKEALNKINNSEDIFPKKIDGEKHILVPKPIVITKQDFISHKNPKSDLTPLPLQNLFFSSESHLHQNSTSSFNSSLINSTSNRNDTKTQGKRHKSNTNLDIFDWSFGDINSNKRVTKFYINLESKCNMFINDTIYYDKDDYTSNFIDHLILHNNFDSIEPRSIYSNDVSINYFIYNKKLNMFTVNFENEKHRNYSIVYEYFANNLIKLKQNKKDVYSNNINSNSEKNVNEFLWKFYNENTNSKNLSLEVEFYFTIDKSFMNENVEFNNKMFMYKTLIENKDTLVFKWNGTLMPYEVKVFESVFPMVFENCQTMTVNFTMILIGAFFVIFIVLILYLLFSSIAKDLN